MDDSEVQQWRIGDKAENKIEEKKCGLDYDGSKYPSFSYGLMGLWPAVKC